jgi:hypothetical protein
VHPDYSLYDGCAARELLPARRFSQKLEQKAIAINGTITRLSASQPKLWCRAPELRAVMVTVPNTRKSLSPWAVAFYAPR